MDHTERDERLRRLEARVVSSDRALQHQAESLMAAASRRAERTATWGLLALSGAAVLVVLDVWFRKRNSSDVRRVLASSRQTASTPPRAASWASWLIGSGGTLWHFMPALRLAWRAVSGLASHRRQDRRDWHDPRWR